MKTEPLYKLLDDLNRTVYLPHIQRPFVWSGDQVRKLLDSLLRGYPIQTLLLWRTKGEIKARRFMDRVVRDVDLHTLYDEHASRANQERLLVLDGQQRLQALRTLFDGGIESDKGVLQEAWIDLTSGDTQNDEGFWYEIKFAEKSPGPAWYRIANLRGIDGKVNGRALGRQAAKAVTPILTGAQEEVDAVLDRVQENAEALVHILKDEGVFYFDELDGIVGDYDYARVLEVFVRVNNGGTKLDAGDLMFAAMKGLSGEIEEQVEEVAQQLCVGDLQFDKAWVLKAIVVALTGNATLEHRLFAGGAGTDLMGRIEKEWPKLEAAFQQLHDIIQQDIGIASDRLLRSYVAFIPILDYLYHFPGPNEGQRRRIVGYFHKAQLFNWFSASTDQLLQGLHPKLVASNGRFPLDDVKAFFSGYRRDVELDATNISGARVRAMILNLVYREKFDTSLFESHFPGNEPHVDHIYPRARLTPLGLGGDEINHLGNFRYVGAKDNIRKRAEPPGAHFARMKASSVPVEKHLLVEPWASQPWPQLREDGERARDVVHPIESPGRAFYEARAAYRIAEDVGLTITYNRMKDPAVTDATVENLRALTLAMDRAVLAAYGWDDLEPPPFTTPATADEKRAVAGFEDAVIDRLFALNAERAKAQGTAGRRNPRGSRVGPGELREGRAAQEEATGVRAA